MEQIRIDSLTEIRYTMILKPLSLHPRETFKQRNKYFTHILCISSIIHDIENWENGSDSRGGNGLG